MKRVLSVLCFLLVISAGYACGTISTSTTLGSDQASAGTCYTIDSANVVLDCAGFTIRYDQSGSGSANGILVSSANNVTIRNCVVIDDSVGGATAHGIVFDASSNGAATGNTVQTNGTFDNYGIVMRFGAYNITVSNNTIRTSSSSDAGYGVMVDQAGGEVITNNRIFTSGASGNDGVFFQADVTASIIADNNITTRFGTGVKISTDDGTNHQVLRNQIVVLNGSSYYGMELSGTSETATFENNTVHIYAAGTGNYGMYVSIGGENHVLRGNYFNITGAGSNQGLHAEFLVNSVIEGNVFNTSGTSGSNYGLYLSDSTTSNYSNNVVVVSGSSSYGLYSTSGSTGNTFENLSIIAPDWSFSDAGGSNAFTNWSFVTDFGSIRYGSISLSDHTLSRGILNVSDNRAFANSSAISALNSTARVTLSGLGVTVPQVQVDIGDTGSFVDCSAPQCTDVEYSGGVLSVTVSGFSSYRVIEVAGAGSSEVPEFSDFALIALLTVVTGGFLYMRKE